MSGLDENELNAMVASAGGLSNLTQMGQGGEQGASAAANKFLTSKDQSYLDYLEPQMKYAYRPGVFDNILKGVNAAAGIGSAFLPGGGIMKSLKGLGGSKNQSARNVYGRSSDG
jgi:hypothetical protein